MSAPLALYNEIDPAACAVLERQIAAGVIAPGVVVSKSIKEISPDELAGFCQVHLFAGGGLWSVAARLAGWPDNRPLWTASCPCQPFSGAGKQGGFDDPRHLWPDVYRLARARRPLVIVGEQVAGKAGYGWFDGVRADMAGEGYASRTVDFPACAIDAPHQRNRQYWASMVYVQGDGWGERRPQHEIRGGRPAFAGANPSSGALDHGQRAGSQGFGGHGDSGGGSIADRSVAKANGGERLSSDSAGAVIQGDPSAGQQRINPEDARIYAGRNGTYWSDSEWINCHDGKARRAKPGVRFLVNGLPGRVDLWRIGGNAIVPQAAAEAIGALIDVYGLPPAWDGGGE